MPHGDLQRPGRQPAHAPPPLRALRGPQLTDLLGLVVASAAAFAATNLDDLLLLALLFGLARSTGAPRPRDVVVGQYAGVGALVAVSALGASGLLLVPDEVVALLGLIPLALGLRGLLALRDRAADEDPPPVLPTRAGALGVASITVANGGDNVAVYVPFLASAGADGLPVVLAVFGAGIAVWLLAGRALGTHPRTVAALERAGHVVVPLVLCALGVAILVHGLA